MHSLIILSFFTHFIPLDHEIVDQNTFLLLGIGLFRTAGHPVPFESNDDILAGIENGCLTPAVILLSENHRRSFGFFSQVKRIILVDPTVITSVQQGNRAAFKTLYESCIRYVYSIVRRYANRESDHPDIIQEIFARLFLSLHTFDPAKGAFKPWLRRLVINQCLKYGQKGRSPQRYVPIEKAPEIANGEDLPFDGMTKADIENYLVRMPDGYRQVFMLYVIDEYAHQEIGELLGISAETSRSQLSRAKNWLRQNVRNDKNKQKLLARGR